ncbi:MAG: FecR domain-containing protein, partial [Bacteroidota bacterium]
MKKENPDEKILQAAKNARIFSLINTESALAKTRDRLGLRKSEAKVRSISPRAMLRIAASILIVASVATALYLNQTATRWTEVYADNSIKEVELPDGSLVTLNRGTTLYYAQNVKVMRSIKLEGEAFFDVQRDETRPFVIAAENARVEVLGTSFNVKSGDERVEVTVASGKVKLGDQQDEISTILTKDQSAVFDTQSKNLASSELDPNYLSWKTGVYSFTNTPVLEALEDLSKFYNVTLQFEESESAKCLITSDFDNADWDEIEQEFNLL